MRAVLVAAILAITLAAQAIHLAKPADRKKAPAFELKNAEGKAVKLADYKGKIVVIDFWATWCVPCRASLPWMNELSAKYKTRGVEFLGISMDDEGWPVVKPFLAEMGVKYPVLLGNDHVATLYGEVDSLPVAFFVDRAQKIAGTHVGASSKDRFEAAIQALLKTK